ncbi:hypothetical protein H0H81_003570, partial [Sphagnurus paluster]
VLQSTQPHFGRPVTPSLAGTGVSFYGQPSDNLQLNYTFDSSTTLVANLDFTHGIPGKTGVRIWGFDNVTAGVHTVSLIPTAGQPIFDYFVITPYASANLAATTIALDDTDPGIKYSGKWTEQSATVYSSGLSYNGTMHGSTTPGDSFTVSFTGDSISVYGLLSQQTGSHSSTYSIDGGPPTSYNYSFNATPTGTSSLNQNFFSIDVIPGQHNLTVTVTEVTGSQTFWIDYVLYQGVAGTTLFPTSPPTSHTISKTIEGLIIAGVIAFIFLWTMRARIMTFFCASKRKENVYERRAASAMPLPSTPLSPAFQTRTEPYRDDDYDTRRLRIEMENLQRENEIIRAQQALLAHRMPPPPVAPVPPPPPVVHSSHQDDAGPAEAPPPYTLTT